MVGLPEQLLLLALNEKGSVVSSASLALPFGLAGAVLTELTLRGSLRAVDGKLVVVDPTPTGDDILDQALRQIQASRRDRRPRVWIDKLSRSVKHLKGRLLQRLVDAGVLRREERRILWLFHADRYPACDQQVESDLRRHLRSIVIDGLKPDLETAMLISLVGACGLVREVFAPAERKQAAGRIQQIAQSEPIGKAVSDSIAAIHAAIAASAAASAAAAAISTR